MSPKLFNTLLVLIPLVLYYGFISPMISGNPGLVWTPNSSVPSLQAQDAQHSDALNQINTIINTISVIDKDYTAITPEEKQKVVTMLPDEIEQIKIQAELRAMADDANVTISGIKIYQDTKGQISGLGGYAVSFTIKAKYPDFKNFVDRYERSQRFFILDTLTIQQQEQKETEKSVAGFDKEVLVSSITSRVYYLK